MIQFESLTLVSPRLEYTMAFDFSRTNSFRLRAELLRYVILGKKTWRHIIKERHRGHVQYNEKLIRETLQNPDSIRQNEDDLDVCLYIKKAEKYWIKPGISVTTKEFRYFIVVVEKNRRFIITMYTSLKIQGGKQIWP